MPSEFFNPADHLLDLVSVDPRVSHHVHSADRVKGLTGQWKSRLHTKESGEEVSGDGRVEGGAVIRRGRSTTSMKVALPVVLERTWKNLWRKKDVSSTPFCLSLERPWKHGKLTDSRHSSIGYCSLLCLVVCLFYFSSV